MVSLNMGLMDLGSNIMWVIYLALGTYILGLIIGYRVGKNRVRPRTVGKIIVNPNANIKNNEPAFKMQITPEFVEAAYSKTLLAKSKYVIFEVKEEYYEDNGML